VFSFLAAPLAAEAVSPQKKFPTVVPHTLGGLPPEEWNRRMDRNRWRCGQKEGRHSGAGDVWTPCGEAEGCLQRHTSREGGAFLIRPHLEAINTRQRNS